MNTSIQKLNRVEATDPEMIAKGVVAFQMVRFSYSFFGAHRTDDLDTMIMADGRQIVIDGNGFIKRGTEIA